MNGTGLEGTVLAVVNLTEILNSPFGREGSSMKVTPGLYTPVSRGLNSVDEEADDIPICTYISLYVDNTHNMNQHANVCTVKNTVEPLYNI